MGEIGVKNAKYLKHFKCQKVALKNAKNDVKFYEMDPWTWLVLTLFLVDQKILKICSDQK